MRKLLIMLLPYLTLGLLLWCGYSIYQFRNEYITNPQILNHYCYWV